MSDKIERLEKAEKLIEEVDEEMREEYGNKHWYYPGCDNTNHTIRYLSKFIDSVEYLEKENE